MALSQVINNWIDEPKLKTSAACAAWLGNDQTHYVVRIEGKDIDDLKELIELSCAWINYHLLQDKADLLKKEVKG